MPNDQFIPAKMLIGDINYNQLTQFQGRRLPPQQSFAGVHIPRWLDMKGNQGIKFEFH